MTLWINLSEFTCFELHSVKRIPLDELVDEFCHLGSVLEARELNARRHVVLHTLRVSIALVKESHDRVVESCARDQLVGKLAVVLAVVQAAQETMRRVDRSTLVARQHVDELEIGADVGGVEQARVALTETRSDWLHLVHAQVGERVEGSVGERGLDIVENAARRLVNEATLDFALFKLTVVFEKALRFDHLTRTWWASAVTQEQVDLFWS